MARGNARKDDATVLNVLTVDQGKFTCCVLGTTPLVMNTMSEKAMHELLYPADAATKKDRRREVLKHDPVEEYRGSMRRLDTTDAPTALALPGAAFKRAMASAALDLPGVAKSVIGRLTWVDGELLPVYGIPALRMDIVRMQNIERTPDVRTRACLREWAAYVSVSFVSPQLTAQAVANLLGAAGLQIGVGDGRQEKGALNFGAFRLVDEDDEAFRAVIASAGRVEQLAAIEKPQAYDSETLRLWTWFEEERARRKLVGAQSAHTTKKPRAAKPNGAGDMEGLSHEAHG